MELYYALRLINIAAGVAVVLLAIRAAVRSWAHLAPSERLILMVIGGYAAGVSSASAIAITRHAPANEAQMLIAVVQVWAMVALSISKKRSRRLTER